MSGLVVGGDIILTNETSVHSKDKFSKKIFIEGFANKAG